jgi:CHAD domain-containing protein
VLGLAAWVEQSPTVPRFVDDDALQRPIDELCPHLLDRLARKVKRRGRHIDRSDADRHALRKSLKKLRSAIDYLQSLYPNKPIKSRRRECKKLLRVFGGINDAVAAAALADSLANQTHPDLISAIGALASWRIRQRASGLKELSKRWKALQDGAEILASMSETLTWVDVALCLGCSIAAGMLIGIDRGMHAHPAGLRTTVLISLAATVR